MQKTEIIEKLKNKELTETLTDIYGDTGRIDYQEARYIAALEKFEMLYGDGDLSIYSAPGRTEIIGNHTDHQHGKVIAAAVSMDAIAIVKKSEDNIVRVVSGDNAEIKVNLENLELDEKEKGTSIALLKGMLNGLQGIGYAIGGFNAYITSDVAVGSGLSSSATFEVLIGNIISGLFNDMLISSVQIAIMGQYAENMYYGKPSGLMDQMACSVGNLVYIDFANPAEPSIEQLHFDFDECGYSLCITDTKENHEELTTEYAAIPAQMKTIANFFEKEVLADVDREEFEKKIPELREKCIDKAILRAIHFFDENERVEKLKKAIKDNNLGRFLELENESGRSSFMYLQNVFLPTENYRQSLSLALGVSDLVLKNTGSFRVHGGGFAGTIQAFVPDEKVAKYKESMDNLFGVGSCNVLRIRKYGGIRVL